MSDESTAARHSPLIAVVAVGTPVTRRPPHGSVRALFSAYGSSRGGLAAKRKRLSRTRFKPASAFPQLCIWDAAVCPVFSLVGRLPSMPSAGEGLPPLFGHFAGTTQPSDSLPAFMSRLWLITFLDRSAPNFGSDTGRASRFSRVEVPCMSGVLDLAGPAGARGTAPTSVAFPPNRQRRHPDFQIFRGSIPRLHVPLSTLRAQPYD